MTKNSNPPKQKSVAGTPWVSPGTHFSSDSPFSRFENDNCTPSKKAVDTVLILLIYARIIKKLIFATGSQNWTGKLRLILNSSRWLKETPSKIVQLWQYLSMTLSFIFHFNDKFLLLSLLFWETEISYCEWMKAGWILYFSLLMVWISSYISFIFNRL